MLDDRVRRPAELGEQPQTEPIVEHALTRARQEAVHPCTRDDSRYTARKEASIGQAGVAAVVGVGA